MNLELLQEFLNDPETLREVLETPEGQKLIPELVRLFKLGDEFAQACKTEPLLGFMPNVTQDRFFKSKVRGKVMSSPNRTGKTTAAAIKMRCMAEGVYPFLPEDHPDYHVRLYWVKGQPKIQVPNRGRLYVNDYKAWERDVQKEWEKWTPRHSYKYVKDGKNISRIQMNNGSTIFIMTQNMEQEASEGGEIHWCAYNEPPKRGHFIAAQRGLMDTNGPWFGAMTILEAEPWVFDQIYTASQTDPNIEIFEGDIEDNMTHRGGVITQDAVDEFDKLLTEDERQSRLHGKPIFLSGQIMKPYKRTPPFHIEPHALPNSAVFFNFIDPHPKKPFASLWLAACPELEQVWAIRSMYGDLDNTNIPHRDIDHFVEDLKKIEKEPWLMFYDPDTGIESPKAIGRPYARFIDPAANTRDPIKGLTVRRELANRGIHCRSWTRADKDTKIITAKRWIQPDANTGVPTVQVWSTADRLDFELRHWFWDPKTGKCRKDYDDCIDCLLAAVGHDIIKMAKGAKGPSRRLIETVRRIPGPYARSGY